MVYNYWTDKITFKKKIATDLLPKLKRYIGKPFTVPQVEEVKKAVAEWMDKLDETLFDCSINFEVGVATDKDGNRADVINGITVIPMDV